MLIVAETIYQKQRDFLLYVSSTLQQKYASNELLSLIEAGAALNGATSDLLSAIEDYPPARWSGLLHENRGIEEVAPYLVSLRAPQWFREGMPLTTFADWLIGQPLFSRWGVFFVSEADFSEVKTFWQRFSYARFSGGKTAYFRFYHPRFFHPLIKNLGVRDYARVSEVVNTIFYFDYFQPNIVHVYRFGENRHQIKTYDLLKEEVSTVASSTVSGFETGEICETA